MVITLSVTADDIFFRWCCLLVSLRLRRDFAEVKNQRDVLIAVAVATVAIAYAIAIAITVAVAVAVAFDFAVAVVDSLAAVAMLADFVA
jgi:hypothetical protein